MNAMTEGRSADPTIEAILRYNEGRPAGLVRLKYARMGADLFAFFRGANHLFADAWPSLVPVDPGPSIVLCGDLHLENFGAYRDVAGDFAYDINDFDEALVGPCSLDLVRCSTSILLASQVWGLSPIQAMRMVLGYLDRYRSTIARVVAGESRVDEIGLDPSAGAISQLLRDCALGTQVELLDHLTRIGKGGARTLRRYRGKLPPADKGKARSLIDAVEAYGRAIGQPAAYRVLDVASRIAGIGSLGVERYVVLVAGDGSPEGNRLLDIKAASPSSLLGCTDAAQLEAWTSDAGRVVDAQRRLQARPSAGLDVIQVEDAGFRLREMVPDENRARLDRLRRKPSKLRQAVAVAGRVTASSQLRGALLDHGEDRTEPLARWAASPALDAVLASAVRFAERSRADFKAFRRAKLDRELG